MSGHSRLYLVLTLLALCGLFLISCSDDDPVEPSGGGNPDTTAPVVVGSEPDPGESSVDASATVEIYFSEAMAPASATGQVTLSSGTISSLTWGDNDQTLEIHHDAWDPGVEVTVTIGTGLTDVAGNSLAAAHTLVFRVYTDQVLAVGSYPVDGATDVIRNGLVNVQFNHEMDEASLLTGITMSVPDKADVPFTVEFMGHDTYALVRESDFPAATEVTVVVGTGCTTASWLGSVPLAQEFTFSFTTGSEIDETPPQIVSITPGSGETISAFTSSIVIVFDEPIHQEYLEFLRVNFQLYFGVEIGDISPSFNADNTVYTMPVATPLPDGTPLMFQLGDFQDASGNVNTTHPEWEVTVAGTAEYFPIYDEFIFAYSVDFVNNEPIVGKGFGSYTMWQLFEWEDGSNFRRYQTDNLLSLEDWEYMTRTDSAIMFRGFRELDEGTPFEAIFDPSIKYLNHPTVPANWSGSSSFTSDGVLATVDYSVRVLGTTTDITYGFLGKESGPWAGVNKAESFEIFWSDCRTVILEYDVSAGIDPVDAGRDTFYYSPGFGLVEFGSWSEEPDSGLEEWEHGKWSDLRWVDDTK